jgi:hypothetical protein
MRNPTKRNVFPHRFPNRHPTQIDNRFLIATRLP